MGKLLDAKDLEAAIKGLLDREEVRGTAVVDVFPDRPETYIEEKMSSASGAIVVALSSFDHDAEEEGRGQFTYVFTVSVLSRNLRALGGHLGAYELTMQSVNALDSDDQTRVYMIAGDNRFRLRVPSGAFRAYDPANGIWQYQFQVEAKQL